MTVEAYHDWGCGALNNTNLCTCELRDDSKIIPLKRATTNAARKLTMTEALKRLDEIAKKLSSS